MNKHYTYSPIVHFMKMFIVDICDIFTLDPKSRAQDEYSCAAPARAKGEKETAEQGLTLIPFGRLLADYICITVFLFSSFYLRVTSYDFLTF